MQRERLEDIQARHGWTVEGLASEAGVTQITITDMLEGIPVLRSTAISVLATIERITGCVYTLDTVEIATKPETAQGSEFMRLLDQIDRETEAALSGLSGIAAGTARHKFITTRWQAVITQHLDALEQADSAPP